MRCPSCNKFAAYDEPEVEVTDSDVDGTTVRGNVRIVLKCAEDGEELKDAELEFEVEIEHECEGVEEKKVELQAKLDKLEESEETPENEEQKGKLEEELAELEEDPEFESDFDASPTDRYEDKDRHGKPIKNPRYQRHYYGAEITGTVKCLRCNAEIKIETSVEEAASDFNELC